MLSRFRTSAVLAAITFAVTGALISPAAAAPAIAHSSTTAAHSVMTTTVSGKRVSSSPATSSFNYSCFGHTGTFLSNGYTTVYDFSGANGAGTWPDGSRGCYGISPGRAIYQINSSSSSWYVIPGNGRADYLYDALQNSSGSQKTLVVGVLSSGNLYSNTYVSGSGWQGWNLY